MGSSTIRSFRDLDAWQRAMELTVLCYRAAQLLPPSERFELSAQIRRAAISVPANIAEGHSTGADGRYIHHLRIASELSTHFELAVRLEIIPQSSVVEVAHQLTRTGQVLHGLLRARRLRRLKKALPPLALFASLALWLGSTVLA